jgi:hypothetical protein
MLQNAITGDFYIGITQGYRQKDLAYRVRKHFQRALAESKAWSLCQDIRRYGPEVYVYAILDVVRGKTSAHALERQLISEHNPTLNTQ